MSSMKITKWCRFLILPSKHWKIEKKNKIEKLIMLTCHQFLNLVWKLQRFNRLSSCYIDSWFLHHSIEKLKKWETDDVDISISEGCMKRTRFKQTNILFILYKVYGTYVHLLTPYSAKEIDLLTLAYLIVAGQLFISSMCLSSSIRVLFNDFVCIY